MAIKHNNRLSILQTRAVNDLHTEHDTLLLEQVVK